VLTGYVLDSCYTLLIRAPEGLQPSRSTRCSAHTTASADFSPALTREISPGKVQNLSPRAAWLYLMRLDDIRASLFPASLPPAPGLAASSCSYGRRFATRFFRLHLAATPCVSLRLPSSAPIGSFHPIRFCPCWAHTGCAAGVVAARWTSSAKRRPASGEIRSKASTAATSVTLAIKDLSLPSGS
jgi:hypothetical protein